jgi:hypothetical protein
MFGDNKFWEKTFQHRMDQRASNEVSDEGVGAMTQAKAGVVEKGRRLCGKKGVMNEPTPTKLSVGSSNTTTLFLVVGATALWSCWANYTPFSLTHLRLLEFRGSTYTLKMTTKPT